MQCLLYCVAAGHIPEHQNCTQYAAIAIAYGCTAVGNIPLNTVFAYQYRVISQAHNGAML